MIEEHGYQNQENDETLAQHDCTSGCMRSPETEKQKTKIPSYEETMHSRLGNLMAPLISAKLNTRQERITRTSSRPRIPVFDLYPLPILLCLTHLQSPRTFHPINLVYLAEPMPIADVPEQERAAQEKRQGDMV